MQTSPKSSGAGKTLPGRKAQGQRRPGIGGNGRNGGKVGKKFQRGAQIQGNAKLRKQRPKCRIWWKGKGRHPDLEYYGLAAWQRMVEMGYTERDLAAAMGVAPSCVHNLLWSKGTTNQEVDRRLHQGLGLKFPALHERAKALRLEAEKNGV